MSTRTESPVATRVTISPVRNEFATEAVPGLCRSGQNSPQKAPFGLYAEQFSGTPFTAPRA